MVTIIHSANTFTVCHDDKSKMFKFTPETYYTVVTALNEKGYTYLKCFTVEGQTSEMFTK